MNQDETIKIFFFTGSKINELTNTATYSTQLDSAQEKRLKIRTSVCAITSFHTHNTASQPAFIIKVVARH